MDEELNYVSSSPLVDTQKPKVKAQDELDLPTLVKVQKILAEQIHAYSLADRLTIDETNFTVKQQLAMNKSIALDLNEVKLMIDSAINNVKEKYAR